MFSGQFNSSQTMAKVTTYCQCTHYQQNAHGSSAFTPALTQAVDLFTLKDTGYVAGLFE